MPTRMELSPINHHLLICDCSYGWPNQKRPRKERIRAVAAQIFNYLEWQDQQQKLLLQTNDLNHSRFLFKRKQLVIGKKDDLEPLQERLMALLASSSIKDKNCIEFKPDLSIQDCVRLYCTKECNSLSKNSKSNENKNENSLENISERDNDNDDLLSKGMNNLQIKNDKEEKQEIAGSDHEVSKDSQHNLQKHIECEILTNQMDDEQAIYLSPDGSITLDPSQPPPKVVVIGMLVDRNVTPNRSKNHAEQLQVVSAKLPLSCIYIQDNDDKNDDEEPLNIDTVLEIMDRWWTNHCFDNQNINNNESEKHGNTNSFVYAATEAMKSHKKRHPKQQALRQVNQKHTN